MGIKEFDNIKFDSVGVLLTESTVLQRCYPLISYVSVFRERFPAVGLCDKYDFIRIYENSPEELSAETGVSPGILRLLDYFLHLYDFRERKLRELTVFDSDFIGKLAESGIKSSGDYLRFYLANGKSNTAERFGAAFEEAEKLFCFCDLMRLPGVKETRAELYFDSGFRRFDNFSEQTAADMQKTISEYIKASGSGKAVPLLKELSTQIAVSRALPHLNGEI